MSDDVAGILPDDELDEEQTKFGPTGADFLEDEELIEVDLDALHEDVLPVEDEFGSLADEFGDTLKPEVGEDEEDDDEEEFYTDEDDEARYNFKADEDPLEEGY
jgi:hypothetical protein